MKVKYLLLPAVLFFLFSKSYAKEKRSKKKFSLSVKEAIRIASKKYGVPERLLYGICKTESGCSERWAFSYHPDKFSYGLFGLTRYTADLPVNDILKQAFLAAKYLRKCYETFRDWDLAVQAYHLGIPYVKRGRRAYKYLQRVKEFSERMIWN